LALVLILGLITYPPPPAPLEIESLEVTRYHGDSDETLGAIGVLTWNAQFNDNVRVKARLSAPGYCYLIALNPDGTIQLCPKAQEDAPPSRADKIVYPSDSYYGLTDGTGLQAFVLVASRKPLPAFASWPARAGLHWSSAAAAMTWRYDGRVFESLGDLPRGTERHASTAPAPFDAICRYLRHLPDVDAVQATAFPVLPAEERKPSPISAP
jgi:hypothetical protein